MNSITGVRRCEHRTQQLLVDLRHLGMGQYTLDRRRWRMVALDHTRADMGLLSQLERGLEEIAVQPHCVIETNKRRGFRTHEPAIADQATNDGTVLLLDPCLIILPISTGTRHFQSLTSAPGDHEFIHEGAVIVKVHALKRKGEQRAGAARIAMLANPKRGARSPP